MLPTKTPSLCLCFKSLNMKEKKEKTVTLYNPHFIEFDETLRINKIEL